MQIENLLDQTFSRSESALSQNRAGATLIISVDIDDQIFSLSALSAKVWESLDGVTPLRKILEDIIASEEMPKKYHERFYNDVTELWQKLLEYKLVTMRKT